MAFSVSWPVFPAAVRKRGAFASLGDARGRDVGVKVRFGVVVGGHLVELAAFLVEANPPAFAVLVVVLDLHADDGADAGEAVDHDADERPVAEADHGGGVDAVEKLAGFFRGEDRGFPPLDDVGGAADGGGRVHRRRPGRSPASRRASGWRRGAA